MNLILFTSICSGVPIVPFASRWQHVAAELVRALCKMPTGDTKLQ